jgi:hypothetical protein
MSLTGVNAGVVTDAEPGNGQRLGWMRQFQLP